MKDEGLSQLATLRSEAQGFLNGRWEALGFMLLERPLAQIRKTDCTRKRFFFVLALLLDRYRSFS
jgi:hypothetical protein